jgi:hypothetical protein
MSGLLGLIGSVGTSLISNRGAKRRQQLADQQNEKFWKMQNAYNTPKQQMSRLQDAGLNPNLIYGSNANTGVAGSISPSKASPYNVQNPVPSMMQTALIGSQIANLDSVTEKNNADTAIKLGTKDSLIRGADAKANIAAQQAIQEAVKTKEISDQQAATTKTLQQKALTSIADRKYAEALTNFRLGLIKLNIDPSGSLNTTLLKWITTSITKAKEDASLQNPGESWIDKKYNQIRRDWKDNEQRMKNK